MKDFEKLNWWTQRVLRVWWVIITVFDIYLYTQGKLIALSVGSWLFLTFALIFGFYMEQQTKKLLAKADETKREVDKLNSRIAKIAGRDDIQWEHRG